MEPRRTEPASSDTIAHLLRAHAFRELFIEQLGWDHYRHSLRIPLGDRLYDLAPIAHKRGLVVFECPVDRLQLRDRASLRTIQRALARQVHENLVIYVDPAKTRQVWQWAMRLPDSRALFHREHPIRSQAPPQTFIDRLFALRVDLAREDSVTLVDVTHSARMAFHRAADEPIFFRSPQFLYEGQRLAQDLATGGAGAMDRFLAFHDRLVWWAAKRFAESGVERDDLLQIARIGLIHAARHFDLTRDTAFSTYAVHCLRRCCINDIPRHAFRASLRIDRFWRYHRLKRHAEQRPPRHGRRPPPAWRQRRFAQDPLIGRWTQRIEPIWNITSIDSPGESRRAAYNLTSPLPGPFELASQNDQDRLIHESIDQLHPTDARILRARFGLDSPEQTLKQLGVAFGVTREAIRQREARALGHLAKRLSKRLGLPLPPKRQIPADDESSTDANSVDAQITPDPAAGFQPAADAPSPFQGEGRGEGATADAEPCGAGFQPAARPENHSSLHLDSVCT